MRLSEISWIVGSSPTMTKNDDRFLLLQESIIFDVQYLHRREYINIMDNNNFQTDKRELSSLLR